MAFEKGHTTNLGRKLSEETRLKMSLAHKDLKPSSWGAGFARGNEPWNSRGAVSRNAYFAGLLDGEGSIMITINDGKYKFGRKVETGRYNKLCVAFGMRADKAQPLFEGQKIWGGTINIRPPRKSNHSKVADWRMWTKVAERFLRSVRPFMRIKSEQLDIALEFRRLQTKRRLDEGGPGSTWILDKELEYRQSLIKKLRLLNK
jgi:hypothetical protein